MNISYWKRKVSCYAHIIWKYLPCLSSILYQNTSRDLVEKCYKFKGNLYWPAVNIISVTGDCRKWRPRATFLSTLAKCFFNMQKGSLQGSNQNVSVRLLSLYLLDQAWPTSVWLRGLSDCIQIDNQVRYQEGSVN